MSTLHVFAYGFLVFDAAAGALLVIGAAAEKLRVKPPGDGIPVVTGAPQKEEDRK